MTKAQSGDRRMTGHTTGGNGETEYVMERDEMLEAARQMEQQLHEAGTRIGYREFRNVARLLDKVQKQLSAVSAEVNQRKASSVY